MPQSPWISPPAPGLNYSINWFQIPDRLKRKDEEEEQADDIDEDVEVDVEECSDGESTKKPHRTSPPRASDSGSEPGEGRESPDSGDEKAGAAARVKIRCNSQELLLADCHLETKDLWDKFHDLGTEMIITKTGRQVISHDAKVFVVSRARDRIRSGSGCHWGCHPRTMERIRVNVNMDSPKPQGTSNAFFTFQRQTFFFFSFILRPNGRGMIHQVCSELWEQKLAYWSYQSVDSFVQLPWGGPQNYKWRGI